MIDITKKVVSASTGPLVNAELQNATDPQVSAKCKYPGAFSWPPRFFEVRQDNVSKEWENLPFTAVLGVETQEVEEDHISCLVCTEENWAPDQHRVDCVLGITQGSKATVQKLIDRDESVHQHKIALLIDGNDSGPDPRLREFFGGLSPQALFDELRKRRYREDDEDDIIDANRRLMYVTDLDAWGIVALIGTSPESLFLVLGDFLYNFIRGSSSLGVSFSTQGPETFVMQFSFPYRAWRSTEQLMMDGRINKSTGKAVRSSRDVTFLRRLAKFEEDRENTDGIYTTNISCIVTGYDQSRWTGLVLLETWFEEAGDDPSPDMVARYENDFEDGMLLDPLCRGKCDVAKSAWSPRPYFIHLLEIRLFQVQREWAALFSHLEDRMNALIMRHKECIERVQNSVLSRESTVSMRQNLKELDELEKGINNVKEIWSDLAQDLQETVRCGDLFMKTDVLYFRNHDEPSDDASTCFPHLTQIRKTFNSLEQLRQTLDDMKKKCREMVEDITSANKMYRRQLQQLQPGTSGGPSAVVEEYNWPTHFRSNESFSHTWENTAFVEAIWYHARQVVAGPAEKEWLESVLTTEDNWAPDKLPAEVVFNILGGATLKQLRDGNDKIPGSKTAILIDDNSPKTRSGFRHLLGGLSAKELFDELLKKRYRDSQMSPDEKDVFVASERRLLYITDLSSWTILALLGSATESFLRPVTNLMINYLTSASSIGVSFSKEGPHTFTLEFSFPFRVWRTAEHRKRDPRFKESNGKPLRPSRDVTFLRALADDCGEATSIDVVYSTHVSCVVTGFDQRKWTGVMLAETWFEADSTMYPTPDVISRYENDSEDGLASDPLCRGKEELNSQACSPRRYFLRVLDIRLGQVHAEWKALENHLRERIHAMSERHNRINSRIRNASHEIRSAESHAFWLHELDEMEEGIAAILDLLRDIVGSLDQTTKSTDSFLSSGFKYFLDLHDENLTSSFPVQSHIRQTFDELVQVRTNLDNLLRNCTSMMEDGLTSRKKYLLRLEIDAAHLNTPQGDITYRNLTRLLNQASQNREHFQYFWVLALLIGFSSHSTVSETPHWIPFAVIMLMPFSLMVYAGLHLQTSLSQIRGAWGSLAEPQTSSQHQTWSWPDQVASGHVTRRASQRGWSRYSAFSPGNLRNDGSFASEGNASAANTQHGDSPLGIVRHSTRTHVLRWIRRATLRSYVENTDTTRGIDLEAHSNTDECIPICLPVNGSRLPALHQPTSRQCHDNKSFFDALRALLREKPWFSWSNLLYCMNLRVPVGIHYVKFQLHPDGFACVSDRAEYPPESESARYRPTRSSINPISSRVFLSYYEETLDLGTDSRSVLDRIVHKLDGPFLSLQPVAEGYGLEIEEGPNGFRLWILKLSSVVVSVLVGVGWSASGRDIQSGFAMTTAVLLVLLALVEGLSLLASS